MAHDASNMDVDSIHITPAEEGGYSVRTSYKGKNKKGDLDSYHDETHVFEDKKGMVSHIEGTCK